MLQGSPFHEGDTLIVIGLHGAVETLKRLEPI